MARALVALLGVLFVATRTPAKQVEVTVDGLLLDPSTGSPVVRLVEKSGSGKAAGDAPARELPIWIGPFEAQAIALEIQGVPPPRPLTHDLMKQLVERLGGKLERVEIFALKDNTYFATLHVASGGKDLAIDARPSDAIALALRFHGPILVSDDLFAKAAATTRASPAAAHLWGLTVQDLTPEMASFFQADDVQGVLVSDVALAAAANGITRGDVITAVDEQPITSVGDLASRAESHPHADPVRLSVRRAGRSLDVRFATPD
jgi:bifunctional DNase/RNase